MKHYLVTLKVFINSVEKYIPSIRFAGSPEEAGQMALEGECHGELEEEVGYFWDTGAECGYVIQSVEEVPAFGDDVMKFLMHNI
jgi:hypothetical protein